MTRMNYEDFLKSNHSEDLRIRVYSSNFVFEFDNEWFVHTQMNFNELVDHFSIPVLSFKMNDVYFDESINDKLRLIISLIVKNMKLFNYDLIVEWNLICKTFIHYFFVDNKIYFTFSLLPMYKQLYNDFLSVQRKGFELFVRKNTDYGDSFKQYGLIGLLVRISDKINRCINVSNNGINLVDDENLYDTILDLHNYTGIILATRK